MQLKQIMTRDVECVRRNDTLAHAAERMRDLNVGCLPVCGDEDRLAGMITDRDITVRGTADRLDPDQARVEQIMSPNIRYCFDDDSIDDAARLMEENQIRRLAIMNRDKRLVGIVSLGDMAVKGGDDRLSGEALEQISEPAEPVR